MKKIHIYPFHNNQANNLINMNDKYLRLIEELKQNNFITTAQVLKCELFKNVFIFKIESKNG